MQQMKGAKEKEKEALAAAAKGDTSVVVPNAARLSLYTSPPTGEVALEMFESSALDRLRGK